MIIPKLVPNRTLGGIVQSTIGSVVGSTGILGGIAGILSSGIGSALNNVLGGNAGIGFTGSDTLVRLSFKRGHPYSSYPGILQPLAQTGGLIFPFRPQISITRQANYESISPVHSMQDYKSFRGNTAAQISITGDYVAQTVEEARYLQAAMHFIRTATLMSFGTGGQVPSGMPPPVLNLSAYGPNNINNVPVLLTISSTEYPPDVDYVNVGGNEIPTIIKLSAVLEVQLSPAQLRRFNLDAFAAGNMQGYI